MPRHPDADYHEELARVLWRIGQYEPMPASKPRTREAVVDEPGDDGKPNARLFVRLVVCTLAAVGVALIVAGLLGGA